MSLQVRNLVLQRGDGVHLLGPLDLHLAAGDRLGLVGESGSGKSLLARALFGVLPPGVRKSDGEVTAFGRALIRPGEEPRMAWVPQDPSSALNPLLSVAQHLGLLPAVLRGEPPGASLSRLGPLLERLRLPRDRAFLARRPHQLSGGQRQRLVQAMALACVPDLLVLDEPTSALDPAARDGFTEAVLDLRRDRGMAFLWITHDLETAARACDRVVVLYGGHALEAGPAAQVLGSPRHPYTARLAEAARGRPSREAGFLAAPEARPEGCPFRPRCPDPGPACRTPRPWRGAPDHGFRCDRPRPKAD